MVCLTVLFFITINKFYCRTYQTSMVSVQGGQDLSISYRKQSCFSHGRGFVQRTYTVLLFLFIYLFFRTYTQPVLPEMSYEISG